MTPAVRFRLIEHTADMGIEARAASPEGVVEAMAQGLAALIFGRCQAAALVTAGISVRAEDPVEMLVCCLNEIVYWSEKDNMVPSALRVESLDYGQLQATIAGEPFDPGRHAIERQVKCVTYHQACFEKTPEGWYARVYVDL